MAEKDLTDAERELLMKQVSMFMETYRQHFDLFVKGTAVYLAIVGAVAGFVFREGATTSLQRALCVFIMLVSLAASIGAYALSKWLGQLRKAVDHMQERLGFERFPFLGAFAMICVLMFLSVLFTGTAGFFAAFVYR